MDEEFHSYIVLASHSDQLYRVWKSLESGNMTVYYTMETESLMPYEYIERNHRRILDVFRTQSTEEICNKIKRHYMVVPEQLFQELQKKKQLEES